MDITVDISMYPLSEEYEQPILDFIQKMHQQAGIEVRTNPMSTQVFGHYDRVMEALKQEIKLAFDRPEAVILAIKLLNRDRRDA